MKKEFDVEQAKRKLENLNAFIASPSHVIYKEHIQKEQAHHTDALLAGPPLTAEDQSRHLVSHGARLAYEDVLNLFEESRDLLATAIAEHEAENPVTQTT